MQNVHAGMKNPILKLPLLLLKPFFLSLFLSLAVLFFLALQTPRHRNPKLSPGLRIRPGYSSYDSYIQHQLNKTLNPKLRKIWTTRDWDRKVLVFSQFFRGLKERKLLFNDSKALCIGARVGQEVEALRRVGVGDSVGIDLVPYPPLFVREIERTLRAGGICVLHVALSRRADKYSANDLYSVAPLVELFRKSDLVGVRNVDGFGLDTEVVFRKKEKEKKN
ncbi:hypothetical protein CK203_095759 [Vitis vinifera]|uniref:Uncharacterized protein n=1 Tax=Vitis vinifera TaxID=29760 RepID=A0A438BQY9_VITVI|nr:hypothetical protein CK203_095759 [Vitis vinifera]